MAQGSKAENTAVNRLIELAQTKPLDDGGFDDLFVDGTARAAREAAKRAAAAPAPAAKPALPPPFSGRVPTSTRTNLQAAPPPPGPRRPQPDDIATKPFDMVDEIDVVIAPVEVVTQVVAPLPRPAPPLPPLPQPAPDEESWFEASRAMERVDDVNATDDVPKVRRGNGAVWLFIGAAFALGLAVAALLFWPGDGKAPAAAPAAPATAQPAAAPAPTVQPIPAAAVAPEPAPVAAVQELAPAEPAVAPLPEPAAAPVVASTDVTLTFESSPPGATVMLVDGTEMIPLGPAPVEHTVAAGKRYEAVFSLPGHASTIVPVEPALGSRVAATLASVDAPAEAAVAVAPAPAVAAPAADQAEAAVASKDVPRASRRDRDRSDRKAKREPKREAKAEAPSGGNGVVMLAAKPPCDIVIDGKKTGKVTPQRSLSLPAGKHTITLVNREHGIKETFSVNVKAGSSVKVIKDLTKKMK